MIDIGVNVNPTFLLDDLDIHLTEMCEAGVKGMICIASDLEESILVQETSLQYLNVWNTIGCHPHQAKTFHATSKKAFSELIFKRRPVAIGETGLDFNRNYSTPEEQIYAFEQQIELAAEFDLPLYLHERDAHDSMIKILSKHSTLAEKSIIHCFTGNEDELSNYLDLGLSIGVTGWVCDERRGADLQASVPKIPLDKLLLETDAPYLLPRSIRPRPKKNHPKYLPWVAEEVARLKEMSVEELNKQVLKNTVNLFNLELAK
ncbi:TatD family hydrolase [Marinomonas sp. C2222]|uniref:TatD family hydrolase n=1 Tax=Marinomonas sargassi TaxID=2984494 RepID=A0ABT2YS96_9GAMM|nr:TatD family hydrolase [Marinomonas sargassi]MCV2402773.1 TatD family hydrolase [Marinomonas sargassi]